MAELLKVENLVKYFPVEKGIFLQRFGGYVSAIDNISFTINKGETLGLVGESGCGKTTVGRTILRLYRPTSGEIFFENNSLSRVNKKTLRHLRKEMQIIFQDPYASLNPRMTIGEIVTEPLRIHNQGDRIRRRKRAQELLETVGLNPEHINRFPHEFSGGQRQRIGIARALALNPKFIICDEPVSALDVSIQAQIINLLEELQKTFGLTYLFIAHDLSVVKHISDRVAVMYLGKIVEICDRDCLYERPHHPYTQSLLSAIPIPDPKLEKERVMIVLEGDIPSSINPPPACRFNTRCPIAKEICFEKEPELLEIESAHLTACHFASKNPIPI